MNRLGIALLSLLSATALAQELKVQPTPFTALIDFDALARPGGSKASLPIWLESIDVIPANPDEAAPKTLIRIRLRHFNGINDELLLRMFFLDRKESAPIVSAWTELGRCVLPQRTLGSDAGLPSSDSVIVPAAQADYVDIGIPGDGTNLGSAMITSLKKAESRHSPDFAAPPVVADPFDGGNPAETSASDSLLFGRVKATLDETTAQLPARDAAGKELEFALQTQPQIGLLTFEVLNADLSSPPEVIVNDRNFGVAALRLPDLADPAYSGTVRPADRDIRFRYRGWVKCQKSIPGSYFQSGPNKVVVRSTDETAAIAIRSIEVQLKYEAESPSIP